VSERAEGAPRAVARVLNVVTLCRLVDFRVKLLLRAGVTILAIVAGLAGGRIAPLVTGFHVGTRSGSENVGR